MVVEKTHLSKTKKIEDHNPEITKVICKDKNFQRDFYWLSSSYDSTLPSASTTRGAGLMPSLGTKIPHASHDTAKKQNTQNFPDVFSLVFLSCLL